MDDEVLGCGATIARHVEQSDTVTVVFVANRIYNHAFDPGAFEREKVCAERAREVLGYDRSVFLGLHDERLDACTQDIIIPLEKAAGEADPELVYLCHRGDNNQDHRAVFQAARVVLRPSATPRIRSVLCYEVPSSTEQSPAFPEAGFLPNVFSRISEDQLRKKLAALNEYDREYRPFPHPRSPEAVEALARVRGSQAGLPAAEAFVLYRELRG
jgi:LmbE family N-acetylglucosaminyl deacetylase